MQWKNLPAGLQFSITQPRVRRLINFPFSVAHSMLHFYSFRTGKMSFHERNYRFFNFCHYYFFFFVLSVLLSFSFFAFSCETANGPIVSYISHCLCFSVCVRESRGVGAMAMYYNVCMPNCVRGMNMKFLDLIFVQVSNRPEIFNNVEVWNCLPLPYRGWVSPNPIEFRPAHLNWIWMACCQANLAYEYSMTWGYVNRWRDL